MAFMFINVDYSDRFANRMVFWKSAVQSSPQSALAHRNLGAMYYLDNDFNKAETEFKKALKIK